MTWDYYVDIAEKVSQKTAELSRLEGELERANRTERSRIRDKIKGIVRRFREEWKQDVDNDVTRVLVAQILDNVINMVVWKIFSERRRAYGNLYAHCLRDDDNGARENCWQHGFPP